MKISKSRLETIIKEEVQKFASIPEAVVLTKDTTAQVVGYVSHVLDRFTRAGGLRKQVSDAILSTVALIDRGITDALIAKLEENPDFLDPSQATTREQNENI